MWNLPNLKIFTKIFFNNRLDGIFQRIIPRYKYIIFNRCGRTIEIYINTGTSDVYNLSRCSHVVVNEKDLSKYGFAMVRHKNSSRYGRDVTGQTRFK